MVVMPEKATESWKASLKNHGWGIGQGLLIAAAFGYLYASVLPALVADWSSDPDYSHGFLVPVLSGYCLWERRHTFTHLPVQPSPVGLLIILLTIRRAQRQEYGQPRQETVRAMYRVRFHPLTSTIG